MLYRFVPSCLALPIARLAIGVANATTSRALPKTGTGDVCSNGEWHVSTKIDWVNRETKLSSKSRGCRGQSLIPLLLNSPAGWPSESRTSAIRSYCVCLITG